MYSVLYVDDEPELLEVSRVFLERNGEFIVDTCTSPLEAIEKINAVDYDALIADYQMPGINGIELLKKIRESGNTIPVIIFTGRGREEVVIEALNSGADFYLQKGGDPKAQFTELIYKLRTAIGQRSTHRELKESREQLSKIIDFFPDATLAIDINKRVIIWNHAIERMTGIPASDIIGKGDYAYTVPFYGEARPQLMDILFEPDHQVAGQYPNIQKEGDILKIEVFCPAIYNGRGAYVAAQASPLRDSTGKIFGAIESIRDITDLKDAERSLRKSEEKYRNVIEDQTEFICRFSPDGTHVFVNEAYCRYFGLKRDEILGKKFVPQIPDKDRKRLIRFFKSLSPDHPVDSIEHRIIMPDSTIRWQRWSDRAIFDSWGNVVEYQSVGRDFTQNKQAEEENKKIHEELVASYEQLAATEEELRQNYNELSQSKRDLQEREERYRSFFDTSRDCVFITSIDGTLLDFNDSAVQFFGYPCRDELQKVSTGDLYVDPRERERHLAVIAKKGYSQEYPVDLKRKDGSVINTLITTVPIKETDGTIIRFQGTIRDVTERKKAEEALLRANRQLNLLTSVTRHDILNKVTIMLGYCALLRRKPDAPEIPGLIDKLVAAVKTVQDEIEFTRKFQEVGVREPQWTNMNDFFRQCRVPPSIIFQHDVPAVKIYADPLIRKVFLNLLDNSIVHGEKVSIIRVSGDETPEGFKVTWWDNGIGIPHDEKEKVFTMGYGRNSGFGLFFVREILSITGISIRETGEPGKGARFEILVPKGAYRFKGK